MSGWAIKRNYHGSEDILSVSCRSQRGNKGKNESVWREGKRVLGKGKRQSCPRFLFSDPIIIIIVEHKAVFFFQVRGFKKGSKASDPDGLENEVSSEEKEFKGGFVTGHTGCEAYGCKWLRSEQVPLRNSKLRT